MTSSNLVPVKLLHVYKCATSPSFDGDVHQRCKLLEWKHYSTSSVGSIMVLLLSAREK